MSRRMIQDIVMSRGGEKSDGKENLGHIKTKKRWPFFKKMVYAFVVIGFVYAFFSISTLLSGAILKVTPRQVSVDIDQSFTAERKSELGKLTFETVKIEKGESLAVPATGVEMVNKKATGRIIVYNDYSAKTQKLIAGTRFETVDGKIYKIPKAIEVPGTTLSGGKIIPGSVETDVTAGEVGSEYNIGLSDFTIPGFKGSARYEKFYARSIVPMTGGFSGEMKIAKDEDLEVAKKSLEDSLREKLNAEIESEVPDKYILFSEVSLFEINFDILNGTSTEEGSGDVVVTANAEMLGYMVDRYRIAKLVAVQSGMTEYKEGDEVLIEGLDDLTIKILNKDSLREVNAPRVVFKISGSSNIVWQYDQELLKKKLVGATASEYASVLSSFPAISSAEAVFKPFWVRVFPRDLDRIIIETASIDSQ